jgi:hypothetical protein
MSIDFVMCWMFSVGVCWLSSVCLSALGCLICLSFFYLLSLLWLGWRVSSGCRRESGGGKVSR